MDFSQIVSRARSAATQGASKARQFASEHSDSINGGLGKAEAFVNEKTGGKYSEHISKGKQGITSALGVPSEAKEAFEAGRTAPETASGPVTVDPVRTEPVDRPGDIGKPEDIGKPGKI